MRYPQKKPGPRQNKTAFIPPPTPSQLRPTTVNHVHEERLRCPDDVSGDIGGCSARRALKTKFYQPTQTMVTMGILPFRENSQGRTGNRTRDLMISSQTLTTRSRGWSRKIIYTLQLREICQ